MAAQITSLTIVYSIVYSGADQRKHQSSASLAFVRGIHRSPVNSPHIWPVTRKMFPFYDVIMLNTASNFTRVSCALSGYCIHVINQPISLLLHWNHCDPSLNQCPWSNHKGNHRVPDHKKQSIFRNMCIFHGIECIRTVEHGNELRLRQNDDMFGFNFLNEKSISLIHISLKSVRRGQINNTTALVQIMAWCRKRSEPMRA